MNKQRHKGIFCSVWSLIIIVMFTCCIQSGKAGEFELINFNAGETCHPEQVYEIMWKCSDTSGYVTITLWNGISGQWSTLVSNVSASELSYPFNIPDSLQGEKFRIKIHKSTGETAISNNFFRILMDETPLGRIGSGAKKLIEKIRHYPKLRVWPMPSNGNIRIESLTSEKLIELEIYTNDGKLCYSKNCSIAQYIELNEYKFEPGTYYIKAILDNGVVATERFIVN